MTKDLPSGYLANERVIPGFEFRQAGSSTRAQNSYLEGWIFEQGQDYGEASRCLGRSQGHASAQWPLLSALVIEQR